MSRRSEACSYRDCAFNTIRHAAHPVHAVPVRLASPTPPSTLPTPVFKPSASKTRRPKATATAAPQSSSPKNAAPASAASPNPAPALPAYAASQSGSGTTSAPSAPAASANGVDRASPASLQASSGDSAVRHTAGYIPFDFAANGPAGPSGVPPATAQPAQSQSGDIQIDPLLTGSTDEAGEYAAQLDRAGHGAHGLGNLVGRSPPLNVIGAGTDDPVQSTSLAAAAATGPEKEEPEGGSKAKAARTLSLKKDKRKFASGKDTIMKKFERLAGETKMVGFVAMAHPSIFGHGRAVDIPHLHTLGSRSMRRSNTSIPTNRLRSDSALKPLLSANLPTHVTHYDLFRLMTASFKTVVDHEQTKQAGSDDRRLKESDRRLAEAERRADEREKALAEERRKSRRKMREAHAQWVTMRQGLVDAGLEGAHLRKTCGKEPDLPDPSSEEELSEEEEDSEDQSDDGSDGQGMLSGLE